MAASSSLENSRFLPDPVSQKSDGSNPIQDDPASAFEARFTDLRAKLEDKAFDQDTFINQVTDQARQLTHADSTVVALRQRGTIVCIARSGTLGPALGTPIDGRSGISGECLRKGLPLRCADTDTDSRVDAEVCRRVGIRSLVVVPISHGSEVLGLVEAFSSRAHGFEDSHVPTLEKLASLIAESRLRRGEEAISPPHENSAVSVRSDAHSVVIPIATPREEPSSKWIDAFRLRPYQIAIVIAFLLLDLGILYWWHQR